MVTLIEAAKIPDDMDLLKISETLGEATSRELYHDKGCSARYTITRKLEKLKIKPEQLKNNLSTTNDEPIEMMKRWKKL